MKINYWLLPAEPARTELATLISGLARRFDAAEFVPHVTIYGTERAPEDDPAQILELVARDFAPVRLRVHELQSSEIFTKTFFVVFHQSPLLDQIADRLRRASAIPAAHGLKPHLSLLYKSMNDDERRELREVLPEAPFSELLCDEICAVPTEGAVETGADVERFRIVARRGLGSAPQRSVGA